MLRQLCIRQYEYIKLVNELYHSAMSSFAQTHATRLSSATIDINPFIAVASTVAHP